MSLRGAFARYKVPLIIVKILLSIALFVYVVAKISPGDIWATLRPAQPMVLTAAALLFLASNLLGSWLWGRLLRVQGVVLPYRKAAAYYFVGLFFNNFFPSNIGGDIARISEASKHSGEVGPAFSATLMDRLLGFLAIALVAVLASFMTLDRFHLYAIYMAISIAFTVGLGLFAAIYHRGILELVEWPFRLVGAHGAADRISSVMDDLHGFRSHPGALLLTFAATILVQISRILVHALVGLAIGVRVAIGYYFLFVPVLGALVSLPISLNGLGIREGAGVVLFRMAGMTSEQAFTVPFLTYLISVLISLLGGLIFVSRPPRRALQALMERRRTAKAATAGGSPGKGGA
jgi:uncharacterized protein (TIRG00374 family)